MMEKNKFLWKFYRIWLRILGFFSPCPFGKDLQNYWNIRRELFSKFDQGIQIDAEGLYSAAPEKVLLKIARKFQGKTVIDAFCGAGASSIALAQYARKVFAIDLDARRLMFAKHNARVYGVLNKLEFINGDSLQIVPTLQAEVVFLDPPWGGPSYIQKPVFGFQDFTVDIKNLLKNLLEKNLLVVLNVPKNFNLKELKSFQASYAVHEQYFLGELCFKTIYFNHA